MLTAALKTLRKTLSDMVSPGGQKFSGVGQKFLTQSPKNLSSDKSFQGDNFFLTGHH